MYCTYMCITSLTILVIFLQWEQFLCLGDDMDDQLVEDKIASQKPEDCVALIYTVRYKCMCWFVVCVLLFKGLGATLLIIGTVYGLVPL